MFQINLSFTTISTFEVIILLFIDRKENGLLGEKYTTLQQDCPKGSLLFDKQNSLAIDFSR